MSVADLGLPSWAIASPKRREHMARVSALALEWADAMRIDPAERDAWRDATRWHDALRDADEPTLRKIVPHLAWPASMLHGPAAAKLLTGDDERRSSVLDAIFWHTVGNAKWDRTGRALYMADFLEPGRKFDRAVRAALAAGVVGDFEGSFRAVVKYRIADRAVDRETMIPETAALWDSVQ